MYCVEQLNDTEILEYEDFDSKVSGKNISEKEYKHALRIWTHFNIQ